MSIRYVIVGGGQAALSAAVKLRELDADASIAMFCAEETPPYQRPPLSKKYLSGDLDAEKLLLRPLEWYTQNRVDLHLGSPVTGLDRQAKTVSVKGGGAYPYDRLLLATGTKVRHLPESLTRGLGGLYTLRTDRDADSKRPNLVAGNKLVIVGGGYIGLEVAAVAAGLGLDVTIIEGAPRILQRVACQDTSDYYRALHTSHGVAILEDVALASFTGADGKVSGVVLSDGQELAADAVLLAIGVEAETRLAQTAGLTVDRGVIVNAFCRTSDPSIFAAGDCAEFPLRGEFVRLESVPHAIHQAEIAAENMLAAEGSVGVEYLATPWFWSDQYDVKLQIAGLNTGYDSTITRPGRREGSQSIWYYKGDTLLAVDAMNDGAAFMAARRIIEAGGSVPKTVAGDTSANLKDYMP
ncbi:MAG: FAD-dependent oxidoreductase [Pseudomonadota bacterium]